MARRKRRTSALSSGSPKSPRVRQDPKNDSGAADHGPSPATDGPGPHNTQVHHPAQSPPPSFPTSRTPQCEERSVPLPPAAEAAFGRAWPCPSRNSPPLRPQPAVPGPAARAAPRPPPPSSAVTTVRGPLYPRQHAAAARTPSPSAALNRTPPSLHDRCCSSSTPPPARAHTSSSETSPVPCPSTVIIPVTRKSYASAVKGGGGGGGPANPNPHAEYSRRLHIYLENCAINSEATACHNHKGPIITRKETGSSELRIVQAHLEEYDTELAHAVFKSQDRFKEWLYPTVSQFLISKGIVNSTVGGMNATFYTMPPSTKTLEEFVREQGPLVSMQSIFDGNFKLCVASGIGMMLVHGFLSYILDIHKLRRTWNGKFSTCHMEVVVESCLKCRITLKSKQGESHCKAADLHKIAEIFKPMFTINEEMAVYFDVLQKDLSKANNGEVEAEWYKGYLLSHLALKPSNARYTLVCGLHHAVDTTKNNGDPIPSVLKETWDWQAIIPPRDSKDISCTDYCLRSVFLFNHNSKNEDVSPFAKTVEALLRYKRHFLQHGQKHIKVQLQHHTELEQFLAKTFPLALPNILRGLLSRSEMNGPFKGHWEEYCSFRVSSDCNTEGRTGIRISFYEYGSGGGLV